MDSLEEKVKVGLSVAKNLVSDMEAKQGDAIQREDWALAAHLATYISGMNQIVIIFEIAVGDE